jgi:hypothetical protein
MAVSLGDAHDQGWQVRVRCAYGKRDAMKTIRECTFNAYLDLPTLLWTRDREFPLAVLGDRLKCPACGSRQVSVMFIPPAGAARTTVRA